MNSVRMTPARAVALVEEGITNEDEIRRVIGLEEW